MKYIACIFLKEGIDKKEKSPMIDVFYHTLESGIEYIEEYLEKGINDFLVFGSTNNKSIDFACENGIVREFIRKVKNSLGDDVKIHADVGLSPYMINGSSVIINDGEIDIRKTYDQIKKLVISFAEAGADYLCPVIPFDDQVGYIRKILEDSNLKNTKIHSYSAKFSSALYGPYFKTVQAEGDDFKRNYYIGPDDSAKAIDNIRLFDLQGANIVMIKPSLFYLDIIYQARQKTDLPLSVYHVSGEYSMIKKTYENDLASEQAVFDEVHEGFNRCGVDYVIGYAPDHFLRWRKFNEQL